MKKHEIERQKEHFEKIAEQYYRARQNSNHLLYKNLLWEYFLERNENIFQRNIEVTCLEAMCGYGEGYKILINYLKKHHPTLKFTYKGFDYSENLVNISNKNNPEINIEHKNILTYSDKNYNCNLIILIGGLHHVYNHSMDAMKNVSTVLNTGGYFINFEPTNNNFIFQKIRELIYNKNTLFDDETEKAFSLIELNKIFKESGYELIDQIYPGLLGYILYYNPDAFPILNVGNNKIVRWLFNIEKKLFLTFLGKYLSFATLTVWKKL